MSAPAKAPTCAEACGCGGRCDETDGGVCAEQACSLCLNGCPNEHCDDPNHLIEGAPA